MGASGSGKTTLLQILGGLDLPSSGTVRIAGQSLAALSDAARGVLRNRALGFVYQFHHLLPEFTALENVAMPLLVRREPVAAAQAEARRLLERVGLGGRLGHRPATALGRRAPARGRRARARHRVRSSCLPTSPRAISTVRNARGVLDLMLELNRELGTSLVIVTHATEIAARMQRVLTLLDGRLVAG